MVLGNTAQNEQQKLRFGNPIYVVGEDGVSWFTQRLYVGYPLLNKWGVSCQASFSMFFLRSALQVPKLNLYTVDIIIFKHVYIYIHIIPRPSTHFTSKMVCFFVDLGFKIHSLLGRIQGFGSLNIIWRLSSKLIINASSMQVWLRQHVQWEVGWVSRLSQTTIILLMRKKKAKSANR